jgi:hypothetical protein
MLAVSSSVQPADSHKKQIVEAYQFKMVHVCVSEQMSNYDIMVALGDVQVYLPIPRPVTCITWRNVPYQQNLRG